MSSLADRLREVFHKEFPMNKDSADVIFEAADELDAKDARIAELEAALRSELASSVLESPEEAQRWCASNGVLGDD